VLERDKVIVELRKDSRDFADICGETDKFGVIIVPVAMHRGGVDGRRGHLVRGKQICHMIAFLVV
jgi:hypothetical protein